MRTFASKNFHRKWYIIYICDSYLIKSSVVRYVPIILNTYCYREVNLPFPLFSQWNLYLLIILKNQHQLIDPSPKTTTKISKLAAFPNEH